MSTWAEQREIIENTPIFKVGQTLVIAAKAPLRYIAQIDKVNLDWVYGGRNPHDQIVELGVEQVGFVFWTDKEGLGWSTHRSYASDPGPMELLAEVGREAS